MGMVSLDGRLCPDLLVPAPERTWPGPLRKERGIPAGQQGLALPFSSQGQQFLLHSADLTLCITTETPQTWALLPTLPSPLFPSVGWCLFVHLLGSSGRVSLRRGSPWVLCLKLLRLLPVRQTSPFVPWGRLWCVPWSVAAVTFLWFAGSVIGGERRPVPVRVCLRLPPPRQDRDDGLLLQ